MSGLLECRYGDVIDTVGEGFGVSKSSFSRRVKEATERQLMDLMERRLDGHRQIREATERLAKTSFTLAEDRLIA